MKRYLVLLALGATLGAVLLARGSRPGSTPGNVRDETATTPTIALALVITPERRLDPPLASIPKDHRVLLRVTNRHSSAVSMTLMGYQDRFAVAAGPDSTWAGEFVADRPGDDFAWMLEGAPVGRLQVTGSHLVEGHR